MIPCRVRPNRRPDTTVFRIYDTAGEVLLAEHTAECGDDPHATFDTLWGAVEASGARLGDDLVTIAVYDGPTGRGLPVG